MNIAVIGLGLIGGSMSKAIKNNTGHKVYGMDISNTVQLRARLIDAIDGILDDEKLAECEMVILALYPKAVVSWLKENAGKIKPGAVVIDCGGVKREICAYAEEIAAKNGFTFIGGHPMAGIERSGFENSAKNLFADACMILTPQQGTDIALMDRLRKFFIEINFRGIRVATPEEHDEIIAYTSQLAHVLSSAYIKGKNSERHMGFSAGSFMDMTRVALMNEEMWTELFLSNADNLSEEIDGLCKRLMEYKAAIDARDAEGLKAMLADGRRRKETVNAQKEALD
ncbi:MAG: prephenate dehydrogenase [Firmicutes bacterium]|nr:prephenate dehydrogenase [Bacillota bacterium]